MHKRDLKDGLVVVLTRDVVNPKPDRRKADRDWASAPVWKNGRRLLVDILDPERAHAARLSAGYYSVGTRDEGFDALLDACEPAPRTLDNLLWSACRAGTLLSHADGALEVLVREGKLSLDDVEAALATASKS